MSSHIDPKVNDEFLEWLNQQYGSHGAVKATRGKIHEFLGVVYDFSEEGILKLPMDEYVKRMLNDFSVKFSENEIAKTPGGNDLFKRGKGKSLEKERNEEFHSVVVKGIILGKPARPDIQTVNSVLSTRIKESNESDWKRLAQLMKYLNGTRGRHLTLKMEDPTTIIWSVNASFGVHDDFISHTGAVMPEDGEKENCNHGTLQLLAVQPWPTAASSAARYLRSTFPGCSLMRLELGSDKPLF